ncbi:adenosylcobinamide-phosphate synthase [Pseudaminobacter salicylatoxidans]|uniref:Cobalamin biosynthesis protein CobD n=1 Tax=Pseudaminobacter salicylatoxidans TaxID=93369 RepID=A0A316BUB9_PSESE|nr:adenosylcobinamide-phosphate synthase CbiB [Pseudaminobacter salicylatoxidans]PWJ77670.1 adenosylcobinamide-phosphate synthase [Pseudaminobacter salicylatoxidans]
MFVLLAFLSLLVELGLGYPDRLVRAIGHPVVWIGHLISFLDRHLNRATHSDIQRRISGVVALVVLVGVPATIALILSLLLSPLPFGIILVAIVGSSLLAQRSLASHVKAVADALDQGGLAAGRRAVSMIVGRDPDQLDEAAVCRAAIESLSENFSDGIVAPAFWLGVGGLVGGVAYKAANTADSMIGHRTPRHEAFGWAAARFDDLVNLPASRLTGLLLVAAAVLVPGADPANAWRTVRRDAGKHRSPNAGWPEAAMAGALGLALAGPRVYGGVLVDDHTMGNGRREATAEDIRRALKLFWTADLIMVAGFGLIAAVVALA